MGKKSEGAEVRAAFDGPDIDHDKLIDKATRFNDEDAERASSAGESRQAIGEFLEETNLNGKAFSWLRVILKQKKVDKAMDIIRSLEAGLPMVKAHLGGQSTPDMFPDNDDEEPVEEPSLEDQLARFTPDEEPVEVPDEDDFDRHLAEAAE